MRNEITADQAPFSFAPRGLPECAFLRGCSGARGGGCDPRPWARPGRRRPGRRCRSLLGADPRSLRRCRPDLVGGGSPGASLPDSDRPARAVPAPRPGAGDVEGPCRRQAHRAQNPGSRSAPRGDRPRAPRSVGRFDDLGVRRDGRWGAVVRCPDSGATYCCEWPGGSMALVADRPDPHRHRWGWQGLTRGCSARPASTRAFRRWRPPDDLQGCEGVWDSDAEARAWGGTDHPGCGLARSAGLRSCCLGGRRGLPPGSVRSGRDDPSPVRSRGSGPVSRAQRIGRANDAYRGRYLVEPESSSHQSQSSWDRGRAGDRHTRSELCPGSFRLARAGGVGAGDFRSRRRGRRLSPSRASVGRRTASRCRSRVSIRLARLGGRRLGGRPHLDTSTRKCTFGAGHGQRRGATPRGRNRRSRRSNDVLPVASAAVAPRDGLDRS